MMISGKKIMLGVSGSIAAYKALDILRRLQEEGASVRVAMTKNAASFVSPMTFQTLSLHPVLWDEFRDSGSSDIGHITITEGLDLAVIAPATANVIGKLAAGIADDALTSALLALECPLVVAPAMNDRMYRNPVVQRNIRSLREQGVRFVDPEEGPLACGTTGQGRLAETERIVQEIASVLSPRPLSGVTVLITAGPTREPIDAVRFISNPSTGRMGFALAEAARDRGADVVLISGPTELTPPRGVSHVSVTTADEMRRAVMDGAGKAGVVIMAAAVSDFRPAERSEGKIKKESAPDVLRLERTEDILLELGKTPGKRLLVGFAAETDSVIENARQKLKQKNLDMIVVNDITRQGAGFGTDTNAVTVLDRSGAVIDLPLMRKSEVASRILDNVAELLQK
jgi:phosphopantothenoylcysteine decarboxylase/phosphopantothenate--cysteine ligase